MSDSSILTLLGRFAASSLVRHPSRHSALVPVSLALLVLGSYLPSLSGGFLNYDDPWLIQNNAWFADPSLSSLIAIWGDWSRETRLGLGAEYLPVRDTSHWLEFRVFGAWAPGMRWVQLMLYLVAILMLRIALRRALALETGRAAAALGEPAESTQSSETSNSFEEQASPRASYNAWLAEGTVWLFALHPVHVESVAWLAGRKDVLALLFVSATAWLHSSASRHRTWGVPLLFALACLSKSMAVASLGILIALDLMRLKPLPLKRYAFLAAVAVGMLAIHLSVGRSVNMIAEPAGGSRWSAALTMGPVWLEYLKLSLWPPALSICHDVSIRTELGWLSVAGWTWIGLWGVLGGYYWRRSRPLVLASWLCFCVPLLPVSQVLFPLQNLMADRYLLFGVLGPCLLGASLLAPNPRRGLWGLGLCVVALTFSSTKRATLFGDSVAVFRDATQKTRKNPIAPYQLASALEANFQQDAALANYLEVLKRQPGDAEVSRRATNNAARLLVRAGSLERADSLLVRGRKLWPDDPKLLANLARVSARRGEFERACRELTLLRERFANYPIDASWQTRCSSD